MKVRRGEQRENDRQPTPMIWTIVQHVYFPDVDVNVTVPQFSANNGVLGSDSIEVDLTPTGTFEFLMYFGISNTSERNEVSIRTISRYRRYQRH